MLKVDSSSFQCHKKVLYDKKYEWTKTYLLSLTPEEKVDCARNMCIKRTDGKYRNKLSDSN